MLRTLTIRSVMIGYHLNRTPMPHMPQVLWKWLAAGVAGIAAVPHAAVGALFRR